MALDIDPDRFRLKLEHTKNWCRPGMLLRSLVGKNQVEVLVGLEILGKLGIQPMEEERVVPR